MSEPPLFRVVRGRPSAEETAALTLVLVAAQAARLRAARQTMTGATGTWASHARGSKSGRSAMSPASTGSTLLRWERASCSNATRLESSLTDRLPSPGSPGGWAYHHHHG